MLNLANAPCPRYCRALSVTPPQTFNYLISGMMRFATYDDVLKALSPLTPVWLDAVLDRNNYPTGRFIMNLKVFSR